MAIQIAYRANTALCLVNFFGEWQRGAYCVLAAVAGPHLSEQSPRLLPTWSRTC